MGESSSGSLVPVVPEVNLFQRGLMIELRSLLGSSIAEQ